MYVLVHHHDSPCQGCLENLFDESRSKLEQLVREHRARGKERACEVGDELKQLCGGGGVVIQEVESKRRGFVAEFDEMRKTAKVSKISC